VPPEKNHARETAVDGAAPSDAFGRWEKRWHPLLREWVLYAAHRNSRPWIGETEAPPDPIPAYDPGCYLCPGNERIGGTVNPAYNQVFVFDNDHPVVGLNAPDVRCGGIYRKAPASGIARVVCFDPRHHVTVPDLSVDQMSEIVSAWRDQSRELGQRQGIDSVLIFENKGSICGTSVAHAHCQVYSTDFTFKNVSRVLEAVTAHRQNERRDLFDDILSMELDDGSRVVEINEGAVAFVPYFARWPYEVWVLPLNRHAHCTDLEDSEIACIAEIYRNVCRRFDMIYDMSFPYVMCMYQAPFDGGEYDDFHLHFVFMPPLRQPSLRKIPAGADLGGGNFMNDTIPEDTAETLRSLNPTAYTPIL
jgi:UDPglucose--hexose-1-phosphate uridylyltransferase